MLACDLVIYNAVCREVIERITFEFTFELKQRAMLRTRRGDVEDVVVLEAGGGAKRVFHHGERRVETA